MTDDDREKFGVAMATLTAIFPRAELSDLRLEVYFHALYDYSVNEVLRAIEKAVQRCKFFPVPAELIEIADEHRRARWEEWERRKALPPAPRTPEEEAEAKQFLVKIHKLLDGLVGHLHLKPAPSRDAARNLALAQRPTPAEAAAHAARKRHALEELQVYAAQTPKDSRRQASGGEVVHPEGLRDRDGGGARPNGQAAPRQPRRRRKLP